MISNYEYSMDCYYMEWELSHGFVYEYMGETL